MPAATAGEDETAPPVVADHSGELALLEQVRVISTHLKDGAAYSAADTMTLTATAVSGAYAYTTSYGMGQVTAVNISNPAAPTVTTEPYDSERGSVDD